MSFQTAHAFAFSLATTLMAAIVIYRAGAARSRPRLSLRSPAIGQRSGRPQPISRASWTARRRSNRKR